MGPQTERDRFVESRVPIFTDNVSRTGLERDQSRVLTSGVGVSQEVESWMSVNGSLHYHVLTIRGVAEESQAFLCLPEVRMC